MIRRIPVLWLGAVVTLAAASRSPARAEEADRLQRLERGDVIVETRPVAGSELPEVTVTAVVEATPEAVWQIIDHCGDYQRTLLRIKSSRELSREGETVRCELLVDTPWPLPKLHSVTVARHVVTPQRRTRTWKLESGDYKDNAGSWTLTPWGSGRTLLEYRLHSEPLISMPASLQAMAMKSAMPDLIQRIRADVK